MFERATPASSGVADVRQLVEKMKQHLPHHQSDRVEALQGHRFEQSSSSFNFAVNQIKKVLDRRCGMKNHMWARDPTMDGVRGRKKSITKHLKGSYNSPPDHITGRAILMFLRNPFDCALGDVPHSEICRAFDFDEISFPNEQNEESQETKANRSRLLDES